MLSTLHGSVHNGKIELSEPADLPEGVKVLVTILREEDERFWSQASQQSLGAIWDNAEDDVYAKLLEK
jgi:hypothetical protein